jgi:phosphonate transport system substrate-binding protein
MKILRAMICLLLLAGRGIAFGQTAAGPHEYVVGITPQFEAKKLFEIWRPILDALEKETGLHFTLRGAPSITDFEQQCVSGQFDFAYVNPFFVSVRNPEGYLPLARDHGSRLSGVVVVRKDSPLRSAKDLDGKKVAFPAANSLAGSLIIRAELEAEYGVHVLPQYVRTHDSSFLNVAVGMADAAGGVKGTLERQPAEVRDLLRELFTTHEVAPLPFVAHPRVPEKVREQVKAALLRLGTSEEGKALLSKVPIRQIGPASMNDYEPLRRMGLERFEK